MYWKNFHCHLFYYDNSVCSLKSFLCFKPPHHFKESIDITCFFTAIKFIVQSIVCVKYFSAQMSLNLRKECADIVLRWQNNNGAKRNCYKNVLKAAYLIAAHLVVLLKTYFMRQQLFLAINHSTIHRFLCLDIFCSGNISFHYIISSFHAPFTHKFNIMKHLVYGRFSHEIFMNINRNSTKKCVLQTVCVNFFARFVSILHCFSICGCVCMWCKSRNISSHCRKCAFSAVKQMKRKNHFNGWENFLSLAHFIKRVNAHLFTSSGRNELDVLLLHFNYWWCF